jgi:hypothetical protein
MTLHRRFKPNLSLTAKMRAPGGIYAREALRRAAVAMDGMRAQCLAGIDRILEQMESWTASSPSGQTDDAIYRLSGDVVDLCGPAAQEGLEVAARSLCDYLDRRAEGEALDPRGIQVHLAAMRLLHRSSAGPVEREAVLDGLARLTAQHDP